MLKTATHYKLAAGATLLVCIWFLLRPIFAGTVTIDPVLLHLGVLQVHWYGVLMALAIASALWLANKVALAGQNGVDSDQLVESSLWMILGGLVGARLMFVALKWPDFAANPTAIWRIDQGGLSLHGALLGGLLALLWFSYRKQIDWRRIADLVALALPVGQIIGRLGNFINQEAFGGPTDLAWKMYIRPENRPVGHEGIEFFHPTFLYESILLACLGLVLWRQQKLLQTPGRLLVLYLGGYSAIRFVVEFFRLDSDHWGPLSVAQWASIAILAWVIIYYYRRRSHG